MINLLPQDLKQDYIYARKNVVLKKYIIISLIGLIGLIIITTFGLIAYKKSYKNNQQQITSLTNQLQHENIASTNQKVQNFTTTFRLVTKALSQEILFSKLITDIGAAMPPNTALTGLSLNNTSNGINLTAKATSYNSATQIQVNLSDPARHLFKNVDIISINNTSQGQYNYSVSLRALFNNTNQFLLINQGTKS
jgi:capsular polysaccharide biosynthesis protein